jgi:SAM-dependent methyltransferase
VAAAAARRPWGRVRVGTAETLDGEALADAVLVLRSWNHIADPDRALAAFARLLRPGGTLLVVDNVAFGLARTRQQQRRAERGPAGFEHHRNDGAGEVHARVLRLALPLALAERCDVGPATSNQWLLRYSRG